MLRMMYKDNCFCHRDRHLSVNLTKLYSHSLQSAVTNVLETFHKDQSLGVLSIHDIATATVLGKRRFKTMQGYVCIAQKSGI